jgi:hypothetical protein
MNSFIILDNTSRMRIDHRSPAASVAFDPNDFDLSDDSSVVDSGVA